MVSVAHHIAVVKRAVAAVNDDTRATVAPDRMASRCARVALPRISWSQGGESPVIRIKSEAEDDYQESEGSLGAPHCRWHAMGAWMGRGGRRTVRVLSGHSRGGA